MSRSLGINKGEEFVLLTPPPSRLPKKIKLFQSLNREDISFLVIPHTYRNSPLTQSDLNKACEKLEIRKSNLTLLFIVSVYISVKKIELSLNIKAPILIDKSKRLCTQYVFDDDKYPIRQML